MAAGTYKEQDMRSLKLYSLLIAVFTVGTVYFVIEGPLRIPEKHSLNQRIVVPDQSQTLFTSFPLRLSDRVPVEVLSGHFIDHVRKLLQNGSVNTYGGEQQRQVGVTVTSQDLKWQENMTVSFDSVYVNFPTVGTYNMTHVYQGHNDSGWSPLYRQRRINLVEACDSFNVTQMDQFDTRRMQTSTLLIDRKHSIIYCPIAKVGTTFWKRTLDVMSQGRKYLSPFQLKLQEIRQTKMEELIEYSSDEQIASFMNNAMSFLFVRDPYSRLYSAFINKLYNPNYHYWKNIGTRIIRAARRRASQDERMYGHNVTFTEFIRFTLKLSELHYRIDPHFAPMYKRCDPCRMPYHFIGKLETFKTDAMYLLEHWKKEFRDFNISFNDFEKETALDTAIGHVDFLFDTWTKIKAIEYPFYNLVLRVWSSLQIRGLLSKDIPLPFGESDMNMLTKEIFIGAIKHALNKPVNKTALKLQREEALIQAYRKVPMVYLDQLKHYVAKDCQLFGYDERPEKIFNKSINYVRDHVYMKGM